MQSITLYELRVIEQDKISRQTAENLNQLFSLIKEVEDKRFHVYRITKSPEGDILNSENLDCKMYGNSLIIKVVENKPKTGKHKRDIRNPITFSVVSKKGPGPKIPSRLFRKTSVIDVSPRRSKPQPRPSSLKAKPSRIKAGSNFTNPRSKSSRAAHRPNSSTSSSSSLPAYIEYVR